MDGGECQRILQPTQSYSATDADYDDSGSGGRGNFPYYKTLFTENAVLKYACILYAAKSIPTL